MPRTVYAGPTVLEALDMQMALRQVEHVPAQTDQFGDAQAVAIGEQDHGGVALPVVTGPPPFRLTMARVFMFVTLLPCYSAPQLLW